MQSGADLKVGKWLNNGYELKPERWPQDSFTKYSRSAGLKYQVQDKENVTFNVFRVSVPNLDKVMRDIS